MSNGYVTALCCPDCGDGTFADKAIAPNEDYPFPHWLDGETGECHACGTPLVVEADGYHAFLREVE